MSKPGTAPLPQANSDRIARIEQRLDVIEPALRQIIQIVKGDTDLRLRPLAEAPEYISKHDERIEELERKNAGLVELVESLKAKVAELEAEKPNPESGAKNAIELWGARYDAYIKMMALAATLVAAISSIISASKGQPPVIGGGP